MIPDHHKVIISFWKLFFLVFCIKSFYAQEKICFTLKSRSLGVSEICWLYIINKGWWKCAQSAFSWHKVIDFSPPHIELSAYFPCKNLSSNFRTRKIPVEFLHFSGGYKDSKSFWDYIEFSAWKDSHGNSIESQFISSQNISCHFFSGGCLNNSKIFPVSAQLHRREKTFITHQSTFCHTSTQQPHLSESFSSHTSQ